MSAGGRTEAGSFHLGCAVWAFPGWIGNFYPRGAKSADLLRLYAERFHAVEGNTTFYSTPAPEMLERWLQLMPEGFGFCPKLPRTITHEGPLAVASGLAKAFCERLHPLRSRLGPMFAQLPGTYAPTELADLRSFLAAWPAEAPRLVLEVRHVDWWKEPASTALRETLTELGHGRVILDTRPIYAFGDDPQRESQRKKPRVPVSFEATARTCFVRFISHPDIERNARWLDEWAEQVDAWLAEGRDVWWFAHCPDETQSPQVARDFHGRLARLRRKRGCRLPTLPWDGIAPEPEQLELF